MRYLHGKYFSMTNRLTAYALLAFLFSTSLTACAQHKATSAVSYDISAADYTSMQQDILKYVNTYRKSKGLTALQLNETASAEAAVHSKEMAQGSSGFGHDGYNTRMKHISEKLGFLRGTAENVAYGMIDAREVVDMWLDSPRHRKNIEGNYSLMGIGIAKSHKGNLYFTQIFLLK